MLDLTQDYFQLFGIKRSYEINPSRLEGRYRELQQLLHPDRYANASDQERRLSIQGAAFVNEAYRTLKDPVARGRYLLRLRGLDPDTRQAAMNPQFLMEQMELREAVEAARHEGDPLQALETLAGEVRAKTAAYEQELARHFEGESDSDTILAELQEMQFLQRIREEISTLEAEIEDALL